MRRPSIPSKLLSSLDLLIYRSGIGLALLDVFLVLEHAAYEVTDGSSMGFSANRHHKGGSQPVLLAYLKATSGTLFPCSSEAP